MTCNFTAYYHNADAGIWYAQIAPGEFYFVKMANAEYSSGACRIATIQAEAEPCEAVDFGTAHNIVSRHVLDKINAVIV